jgi:hypothetical protein
VGVIDMPRKKRSPKNTSNNGETGKPTKDGFRTKGLMLDYLDSLLLLGESGKRINKPTHRHLKQEISLLMDDVDRVENQKTWKEAMKGRLKKLSDLLDEMVVAE